MKTSLRLTTALAAILVTAIAGAQSWSSAYEEGLREARQNRWTEARDAFKRAAATRPEDASAPTVLPGPPTERRRWREGAPYSPNFLAAYSLYRAALARPAGEEQSNDLRTAATELETLLEKGQGSRATYFVLNQIYTKLGDTQRVQTLDQRFQQAPGGANFRVDLAPVVPEEVAAMNPTPAANTGTSRSETIKAGDLAPGTTNVTPGALVPGAVVSIPTKFALIVGNSESRLPGGAIAHAAEDAQRIRDVVVGSAGYPEGNVELLLNATADQIRERAKALADRMPQDGTIMLFFTGVGTHVGGKDYFAGVNTEGLSSTGSMLAKSDLYQVFMSKGAQIFAFFQTNRPINEGRYFGSEMPMVGTIAQMQATLPGESVTSITQGGRTNGLFVQAMVDVFQDLKSNRIPILEYGWQVFYKIRRGNTGTTGGGSRQTPTLPVLTNLASDARF